MARKITAEDIQKINEIYFEVGTYAETARRTGFSPSTVKKYVQKDFSAAVIPQDKIFKKENIPPIDLSIFQGVKNLGNLCVLSEEEFEGVKELWKEMSV